VKTCQATLRIIIDPDSMELGMKNAPGPVKIIPDHFAKNLSNAIDFKRRIAAANESEWT
jgi:hypothetical protein